MNGFNFSAYPAPDANALSTIMPLPLPGAERPPLDDLHSQSPNSDAFQSSQNIPQLVLNPLFVDNLAKDFELTGAQRAQLHTCAQLGSVNGGLVKADLSTRLSVCYHESNTTRHAIERNSIENISQLVEDLRVWLDDSYTFTKEQMRNIRSQAQDSIYEATRTCYMRVHNDVLQKCRENKGSMKLNGVFGNPSREKALASLVKKICSSVRNSLRQDLRFSICGDTATTLALFTYSSATKFKRGGPGLNLDISFTVHNALLHRFARENPQSIGVEEVEDDDSLNDDPDSSPAPASKKRKIAATTHGGGRIAKGKDFWSQVDAFFARKMVGFGSGNLQTPGWKVYTSETVQIDEELFPTPPEDEMFVEQQPARVAATTGPSSSSSNLLRHL